MHNKVHRIPGTNRQTVTAADGTAMVRRYVYLLPSAWSSLQEKARVAGTSVSQQIATFATSGAVTSKKESHEHTNTSNA
jgi:hypothetical protein